MRKTIEKSTKIAHNKEVITIKSKEQKIPSENLRFFMDETSAPYEDNENPFPRTQQDEMFDDQMIKKYHLVTNNNDQ